MGANEHLSTKWKDLIDVPGLPELKGYRRSVVANILENTERELRSAAMAGAFQHLTEAGTTVVPANFMGASSSTAGTGGIDTFDPILISLVRRAVPNLIAYDICGVQPMTGPTGLIFCLRSRYSNQTGTETFYNEVNTAFATVVSGANTLGQKHVGSLPGNTTQTSNLAATGLYNYGTAMSTAQAEALGTDANVAFPQMGFTIEKVSVTAQSRALKAEYTLELAQDLRAIHGLDAEAELSNILTTEILAEINREVIRTINISAKPGAQVDTVTPGIFDLDTDSNGRWSVEKFKGMVYWLDRECNQIAKDTRRGKGNIMLCSSDVASALVAAEVLDYTPALSAALTVDDTGNTFAGVLNGRIKVYIDPYSAGGQYATVGYKGPGFADAGLFYCPYVPLQMVRAIDQDTFAPKIGFKTRYGIVENPFSKGAPSGHVDGTVTVDTNVYYRRSLIVNLM